jgi:tetratricopeptide (TPR) repeat protein
MTSLSSYDDAIRQYRSGRPGVALHTLELFLGENPDHAGALLSDAFIQNEMGKPELAIQRLEHLVKLYKDTFAAWEMLTQLYQDVGDLQSRDNAVANVRRIYRGANLADIRNKAYFVREKLAVGGRVYFVRDILYPGNGDIYRYVFVPISELSQPRHIITLRSELSLNQVWADEGKLNHLSRLYTLDRLDIEPETETRRETFQFYVSEPSYDEIREKVIQILSGQAKPMSSGEDKAPVMSFTLPPLDPGPP